MYKGMEFAVSIDAGLKRLEKVYKGELDLLEQAGEDRESVIQALFTLHHSQVRNSGHTAYDTVLSLYFAAKRDFKRAWIMQKYLGIMWNWENSDTRAKHRTHFQQGRPYEEPGKAREHFETRVKEIGNDFEDLYQVPYDFSPEARHTRTKEDGEVHLSIDSCILHHYMCYTLMCLGRHAEAAEVLFRFQHALRKELSREISGQPKLRAVAPLYFMYDAWFHLRMADDAETKRACGWMGLYWALEAGSQSAKRDYGTTVINGHEYRLIIQESDLFGRDQKEYLTYFGSGFPWMDIGLPDYDEFQGRYDEFKKTEREKPPRFKMLRGRL